MSLIWTYVLIGIIYGVLGMLYILNRKIDKKFLENYPEAKVYKGERKDFFTTIAVVCVILTITINGLSLYGGNGVNIHTIIITLGIVGMSLLTRHINVLISDTCFNIAGFEFTEENIEKFSQNEKNGKTKNSIIFNKSINGYEGIEFFTNANVSKDLGELIKNK